MMSGTDDGLHWENITYDIPLPRKQRKAAIAAASSDAAEKGTPANGPKPGDRRILNGISGHVRRGELLAILGASGAGKSTCQAILAARLSNFGTLSGTVTFDGKPRDPRTWKRSTAFVEQDDVLIGELTVEETLRFAARLRLPSRAYTRAQKVARADHVLDMLRLNAVAQSPIGTGLARGISGGERKRVSIACELVTEPQLLMLDEPTSGLDSFSSFNVIDNVRQITREQNISTLITIHQPSFAVFCLADRVMLLARGGVYYEGPPGEEAAEYFASLGFVPGEGVNPADYYLELVSNLERNEEGEARITRLLDAWQEQIKRGPIQRKQHSGQKSAQATIAATEALISRKQDEQARGELNTDSAPSSATATPDAQTALSPEKEKTVSTPTSDPAAAPADEKPSDRTSTPTTDEKAPRSARNGTEEEKKQVVAANYDSWPISWPEELVILYQRNLIQQLRDRELLIGTQAQSIILLIIIGFAFFRLGFESTDVLARIGALFVIPTNASFAVLFPIVSVFPLQRQVMLRERSAGVYRVSAFFVGKVLLEIPSQIVQRALFYLVVYWMVGLQPSRYGVWIAINFLQVACSVSLGLFIGSVSPSLNVANVLAPLINVMFLLFAPTLLPNPPPWFIWIRYISPLTYSIMALIRNEMQGLQFQCNGEPQCYPDGNAVLEGYNLTTFTVAECAGFIFAIMAVLLLLGYIGLRIVARPNFRYTK